MINQENSKYDSLNQPVENKQQLAYQQIKQDILNNTYPAGTVMVERKLCEIYNVSRSPIPECPAAADPRRSALFCSGEGNCRGILFHR